MATTVIDNTPTVIVVHGDVGGRRHECSCPWPAGTQVQAGRDGLVIVAGTGAHRGSYRTAYFEAFPTEPATFIRGEGATTEDAEADAWAKWQTIAACPGHEFERRGLRNGAGYCRHCTMFASRVFEPISVTDAERAAVKAHVEQHLPDGAVYSTADPGELRQAWNAARDDDPETTATLAYAAGEILAAALLAPLVDHLTADGNDG